MPRSRNWRGDWWCKRLLMSVHHHLSIMPDLGGIFLMAGSWAPFLAITLNAGTMAFIMSMLVSMLAVMDYVMKIHWKLKMRRNGKIEAKKRIEAEKNGNCDGRSA
jgi:predicted membrane channel-forming protein YqfA (hemolysin III family)